jgi:hypothetical protein
VKLLFVLLMLASASCLRGKCYESVSDKDEGLYCDNGATLVYWNGRWACVCGPVENRTVEQNSVDQQE